MPQINLIPEVLYEPNQPYHYLYDNIPLKNILARISLVNIQADTNAEMLRGLAGSAGSISARLDESLEGDGSLKTSGVDASMHSIAYHEDGEKDGVEYVRMRADERSKLSLIESLANVLTLQVNDEAALSSGNVEFRDSTSVFVTLEPPNVVRIHHKIPADVAHRHQYGQTPANVTVGDWQHFMTTTSSTPYMDGSLRVYINGLMIGSGIRVPIFSGSSEPDSWMLFEVSSEDSENGTFELNANIPYPNYNIIKIDFDTVIPMSSSSSSSSS